MKKTFEYMSRKKINSNTDISTIMVREYYPEWYIFCPWKWGKLLEGFKCRYIKLKHPRRGGNRWREDVVLLSRNEELNKDDWEKVLILIYHNSPAICLQPPIPIIRKKDFVESYYDLTKLRRYAPHNPGKVDLVTEVIKVRTSPSKDDLKWLDTPKIGDK